jgi:hypothetical protein
MSPSRQSSPTPTPPEPATARALIDLDTCPTTHGQEVILLGRISGTFAVRRLT